MKKADIVASGLSEVEARVKNHSDYWTYSKVNASGTVPNDNDKHSRGPFKHDLPGGRWIRANFDDGTCAVANEI